MNLRNFQKPIQLNGASCSIQSGSLLFKGPKGSIESPTIPNYLDIQVENNFLTIKQKDALIEKSDRSMAGTFKAIVKSLIEGVTESHSINVVFTGTGSNVQVVGNKLIMKIGKSHLVERILPEGVKCALISSEIKFFKIGLSGVDASIVGKFARELCDMVINRYEGGVHIYIDTQKPQLKEGKKGKKGKK